jgi:hypothetical protein
MGDGAHDDVDGGPSPASNGTSGEGAGAESGGWTVVGPDGRVRTFSSRDDVLASLAASNEVTAAPPEVELGPRRLSLVPEEDPPPLPSKARRRSKAPEELSTKDLLPAESPPDSSDSAELVESSNVLDVISTDTESTDALEESGPTSSDLQPDPSVRSPAVVTAAELAHRDDANEGELVSLRDLVVVPVIEPEIHESESGRSSSVPPPPKAGALRTLPPASRSLAPPPPPPTITVASTPPPAVDARPSRSVPTTSVAAPPPAQRGWLMPVAICAVLAGVVAYVTRGAPPPGPAPTTVAGEPSSTASSVATSPTAMGTGTSGRLAPASSTGAASMGVASTASDAGVDAQGAVRTAGGGATEVDSQLALSEVLSRAGAARRGGDPARAKALYERALALSAGNVEANGGLAEIARAQGDLAGAKALYEKALATSPSYGPALLGVADVEWDLGERDAAQRRYRELIAASASAPERAKERAGGGAPAAPSAAPSAAPPPAPTVAPAPEE